MIAGVLQRFEGQLPGTAFFVLDPGDALLWLQREGATEDPLGRFVEWGGHVLSGVVEQLVSQTDVEHGAPVVLMHMRGTPRTMQADTRYDDLLGSVLDFLQARTNAAIAGGVREDRIVVDPGIGFGKSCEGNLAILRRIGALAAVDKPILIGASRKTFIGNVLDLPVDDRLHGSLAVAAFASAQGAHIIRAHDVAATVRVVRMIDAIRNS